MKKKKTFQIEIFALYRKSSENWKQPKWKRKQYTKTLEEKEGKKRRETVQVCFDSLRNTHNNNNNNKW